MKAGKASLFFGTMASAMPLASRQSGSTQFLIGQNYLNEWRGFESGVQTPAGISLYGDIWTGALNTDSQELLTAYAADHDGFVELGISWKDDMTNRGYTQFQGAKLCNDIASGVFDAELNSLAEYLAGFPNVQYLFRIDYEVSGNLHANTNENEFDPETWDFEAYPAAYRHVHEVVGATLSNVAFMFHPVRGSAEQLYPGDDVVDYQGFSIFNNDVCIPVGGTANCEGDVLDPNVILDIEFATKPKWVAESGVQPPASENADTTIEYFTRLVNMIEEYDFAGWAYINSNWPEHGWPPEVWGDSRIETNAPLLEWFNTNVVDNARYIFG